MGGTALPENLKPLVDAIVEMREDEAIRLARTSLERGTDPLDIVAACRQAMEEVGRRFEQEEFFLPELMLAGEMLTEISGLVKAAVKDDGSAQGGRNGKVLLGTVKGDIHDIGKNIVAFVLDAQGFEVIDIGVDIPPAKFVEAIKQHQPQVVGMSCLLTLAYDPMKETVAAIAQAGLRDKVKIMIGGAATSEEIRDYTGADAWGKTATDAVTLARKWVSA